MKIHDVVALMENLPEHGLKRGQVGTIVEHWQADVYEVEFSDTNGMTYAMVALRDDQLMTLFYHPDSSSRAS